VKNSISQVFSGALIAIGSIPITWLFFGPVAGFHHMYGFGITFYLILDGETPTLHPYRWGDFGVRFFWGRFAFSLALWLVSVFLLVKLVRVLMGEITAYKNKKLANQNHE
jgi:hypothetical protein